MSFCRLPRQPKSCQGTPLGQAIVRRAVKENITITEPSEFAAVPGGGMKARVKDGGEVLIGNEGMLQKEGIDTSPVGTLPERISSEARTPVFMALDGRIVAAFSIADTLKEDSPAAMRDLLAMGIDVIMLTGDHKRTAQAIAGELGIRNFFAEVLPEQKIEVVRKVKPEGKTTAMAFSSVSVVSNSLRLRRKRL